MSYFGLGLFIEGVIITGLIINEVGGFSKIISLFKPNNVVEPMNDFEMAEVGDPEVDASPQAPPEVWRNNKNMIQSEFFWAGLC